MYITKHNHETGFTYIKSPFGFDVIPTIDIIQKYYMFSVIFIPYVSASQGVLIERTSDIMVVVKGLQPVPLPCRT